MMIRSGNKICALKETSKGLHNLFSLMVKAAKALPTQIFYTQPGDPTDACRSIEVSLLNETRRYPPSRSLLVLRTKISLSSFRQ